jgi:UDP-N-acetylmuramate: L-alanyl-gamma-D-glutamyl-meso-diaminopimelate ligase
MESKGTFDGIKFYDDFAHHPTAIDFSSNALRSKYPTKKILGLIELGSNTMASGSHGLSILNSVKSLDDVIWLDHNDALKEAKGIYRYSDSEDFISSAKDMMLDYDIVILMTNKNSQKIIDPLIKSFEKK